MMRAVEQVHLFLAKGVVTNRHPARDRLARRDQAGLCHRRERVRDDGGAGIHELQPSHPVPLRVSPEDVRRVVDRRRDLVRWIGVQLIGELMRDRQPCPIWPIISGDQRVIEVEQDRFGQHGRDSNAGLAGRAATF